MIAAAVLSLGLLAEAPVPTGDPAVEMTAAATAFLRTVSPALASRGSLPFESDERLSWSYLPGTRPGVALEDLTPAGRTAAFTLLKASLSASGFRKAETVRILEDVLAATEGSFRDPDRYYLTFFGAPTAGGTWGLRYEGHHIALHWTIVRGRLAASTPQFLGAHPTDVVSGPQRGTRALAAEEDLARSLVTSMSAERRTVAIVSAQAPGDILTGRQREVHVDGPRGIAYAALSPAEQGLLLSLVQEYAFVQTEAVSRARLSRVRAELPEVTFAWMGGLAKGQGHYYRIQGRTFLIEYDNTQHGARHAHTVWRERTGDWGRDLLADHYRTAPHHARSTPPRPVANRSPRPRGQRTEQGAGT